MDLEERQSARKIRMLATNQSTVNFFKKTPIRKGNV
jgi:hypothetical protein